MGHIDNVYEEMSKSLVTVLCSDFEGLPLVILESMINNTPVICYDINYGPRDVIIDKVNGFLIPPNDIIILSMTIQKIFENPKTVIEMGKQAKQHILDNFSEQIVYNKWESLFKNLYSNDQNK